MEIMTLMMMMMHDDDDDDVDYDDDDEEEDGDDDNDDGRDNMNSIKDGDWMLANVTTLTRTEWSTIKLIN